MLIFGSLYLLTNDLTAKSLKANGTGFTEHLSIFVAQQTGRSLLLFRKRQLEERIIEAHLFSRSAAFNMLNGLFEH